MNRRSDIGWFELIVGIILIIFGVVIMRQPVGVLTWIVILCGVLAILSGIGDIVLYVKMEHFTGFGPIVSLVTGILSVMAGSYCEEQLENGEIRVVLKLPAALAPIKLAVLPLVKKDGLPEKAREIIDALKFHFHCQYDEKDSIGKRYRRQDAIGTPFCVTVDHQTLEDNCVTLRNRDTMQQERVAISELNNIIADRVSITSLLKTLQ